MDRELIRNLVAKCIDAHFNAAIEQASRLGGDSASVIGAMQAVQCSLLQATMKTTARIYPDQEFSARLAVPGIDLGYRHVLVTTADSKDEWIAALSISLDELDEQACKIIQRWHDQDELRQEVGPTVARRLVLFVVHDINETTLNPLAVIAAEDAAASLVFVPCVFSWGILQPDGSTAAIGHLTVTQARLEQAHRLLAVIDSPHTARLMDEHMRSEQAQSSAPAAVH